MGNRRRIIKQLNKPMAMADTKIVFNKCRVFLNHPDPNVAGRAAQQFAEFMTHLNNRARLPNMHDLYDAHFKVLDKMLVGESIVN